MSTRTLRRKANKDFGIYARRPRNKPFLNTKHIRNRLKWAKKYKNWKIEWENVFLFIIKTVINKL